MTEKPEPIYLQRWVWYEVCKRDPEKYSRTAMTYQGRRVILT